MKKVWDYGTSTPIQRVGVIFLVIGLLSLFSWMIKEDLSFDDLLESYYLPRSRDSFFFHLFFYFIPLGLLMSWGYQILLNIKRWILNGKIEKTITPKQKIYFKDNLAAFEFACSIYPATLDLNKVYFGIVKDIVLTSSERFQFTIETANTNTTIKVYGYNDKYSSAIKINSLVFWLCEKPITNKNFLNIEALGSILFTLKPEFNPETNKWEILQNLSK